MASDRMQAIYKATDTHIHGFFDKHRFLSNFHVSPVLYDGITYPSNENAYQAMKTMNLEDRKTIRRATPSGAKGIGKRVVLREDWDEPLIKELQESDSQGPLLEVVKDRIMYEINSVKFLDPTLRLALLETGDLILEETNWWNDKYWGVCNGKGLNKLGRILMKIRTHYKNQPLV